MASQLKFLPRTFSGIQPTGVLHLGNYFGAVKRWVDTAHNRSEDSADLVEPHQKLFFLADLHALTSHQDPVKLRADIFKMTASLLSCGLDPDKCVLFQQSQIPQHAELCWIFTNQVTLGQLGKLGQYKEKAKGKKEVPLGLFMYPVLQAADILLYRPTRVPVGADNLQNVEVAHSIARNFNRNYKCEFFPYVDLQILDDSRGRLKSLRDPGKKMSKSDPDVKSCIYVDDEPDVIVSKCKKAVTDFTSEVTFDPVERPGVSNLVTIHSGLTGQTPEEVCEEVKGLDTGRYKLRLAEVIVENLKPIREKILYFDANKDHLENILEQGSDKARFIAEETLSEVKRIVGLQK